MVLAIVSATIAFNIAVYLVLATFLREMKRKSSYLEIPELKGVVPVLLVYFWPLETCLT